MSDKKQSSINFLKKKLITRQNTHIIHGEEIIFISLEKLNKLFKQAKVIHKEEIKDAVGVGSQFDRDYLYGYHDKAEQYYNENYGNN